MHRWRQDHHPFFKRAKIWGGYTPTYPSFRIFRKLFRQKLVLKLKLQCLGVKSLRGAPPNRRWGDEREGDLPGNVPIYDFP